MATTDALFDTDVFIDHLRGARQLPRRDASVFYSVVTRAELFAGQHVQERDVADLLAPFTELAIERQIAEVAGRIRRETQLALPDALIAASALELRLTLMSRNLRHFERVRGLALESPG